MDFPIKGISDLEKLSHAVKWQYFEKLVAFIFEQNEFRVQVGKVIKIEGGKRQFDAIADKYDMIFAIECKKWAHRQRVPALKRAVGRHLERCSYLQSTKMIKPVLIVLYDDDINMVEDVPVVPIMKLNWFLNNYDTL